MNLPKNQVNNEMLPIIFIHKGDSSYLHYVLKCARIFNPYTRVILLGDESNRHYQSLDIEHFYFANFKGAELELFDKVFKYIAGSQEPRGEWWVRIVFQRWFHMYYFIKSQSIDKFWTFDSDTLILCDLSNQVSKFAGYDCTEQCNGMCMNGLINNAIVVKGYLDKINNLFQDEGYLNDLKVSFETQPTYAFTEMAAYFSYKDNSHIKTLRLNTIIDGESFDDCICQSHDTEMEKAVVLGQNSEIKKLFFINGYVYVKYLPTNSLIKMNTLNMSWVDDDVIEKVFNYVCGNL